MGKKKSRKKPADLKPSVAEPVEEPEPVLKRSHRAKHVSRAELHEIQQAETEAKEANAKQKRAQTRKSKVEEQSAPVLSPRNSLEADSESDSDDADLSHSEIDDADGVETPMCQYELLRARNIAEIAAHMENLGYGSKKATPTEKKRKADGSKPAAKGTPKKKAAGGKGQLTQASSDLTKELQRSREQSKARKAEDDRHNAEVLSSTAQVAPAPSAPSAPAAPDVQSSVASLSAALPPPAAAALQLLLATLQAPGFSLASTPVSTDAAWVQESTAFAKGHRLAQEIRMDDLLADLTTLDFTRYVRKATSFLFTREQLANGSVGGLGVHMALDAERTDFIRRLAALRWRRSATAVNTEINQKCAEARKAIAKQR